MKQPINSCYWVDPGRLLAGEYPGDVDDESAQRKLARLTDAGVTAFIDLTEEGELYPYAHWLENVAYERFPIPDCSVPDSTTLTITALDAIDQHIVEGRLVYVHCWGGVGRTGLIVGCWLARHGDDGADALTRLRELWRSCPKSRDRKSPETPEQERYVQEWKEPR